MRADDAENYGCARWCQALRPYDRSVRGEAIRRQPVEKHRSGVPCVRSAQLRMHGHTVTIHRYNKKCSMGIPAAREEAEVGTIASCGGVWRGAHEANLATTCPTHICS